jgi:hypothetical protein
MEYRIKFLETGSEGERRCHFYVGRERLALVADWGTPWLEEERRKVRFARPSGEVIASLQFPGLEVTSKGGQVRISYALIYNDAVYAILTKYPWPDPDNDEALPYFMIEVEEQRWLALGGRVNGRSSPLKFTLCDNPPGDLQVYADPLDVCGADPIGEIDQTDKGEFTITLPDGRFRHPHLILLALVFLIYQLP